jgi:uncharacterized protein YdeI (YjbR/CyaY-like superfamily)
MQINYFPSTHEFRLWLQEHHLSHKEIIVGYYKVKTGKPSMTWSDSVDVALCFGWIDGIRRSVDDESYCIRFTPRNPKSIWSKINIEKVERLTKEGMMTEAGLAAFEKRKNEKSGIYSFENDQRELPDEYQKLLKNNTKAYASFEKMPPSHKKAYIHWILSAKQEKTQLSRFMKMIEALESGKRLF